MLIYSKEELLKPFNKNVLISLELSKGTGKQV